MALCAKTSYGENVFLIAGETVLEYLTNTNKNALLAISTATSRSLSLLLASLSKKGFTFQNVHPVFRASKALMRLAIEKFQYTRSDTKQKEFNELWRTVTFKTDLLALACSRHQEAAYVYATPALRKNENFVRSIVDNAVDAKAMIKWYDLEGGSTEWIPDTLLSRDRDFALLCAQKGICPFGTNQDCWLGDEEIIEAYIFSNSKAMLPERVIEFLLCTQEGVQFLHRFTAKHPREAIENFFPHITDPDLVSQMLRMHFTDKNKHHAVYLNEDSFNEVVWNDIWRQVIAMNPPAVSGVAAVMMDGWDDRRLVERTYRRWLEDNKPISFFRCGMVPCRWIARIVFSMRGMEICGTEWTKDREMILVAVAQDGRVLKHLLQHFHEHKIWDSEIFLAAVRQTYTAIAWIPDRYFRFGEFRQAIYDEGCRQNLSATRALLPEDADIQW